MQALLDPVTQHSYTPVPGKCMAVFKHFLWCVPGVPPPTAKLAGIVQAGAKRARCRAGSPANVKHLGCFSLSSMLVYALYLMRGAQLLDLCCCAPGGQGQHAHAMWCC